MKNLMFALLSVSSLLCRAEGLPDLGDISQATVSPQQERQIGEQSMFEIRADRSYLDDAEISDYLNGLGYQLVANSSEPGQPFEFFAINDNAINAFALPGGFIGVNSGLILIAQSESELASVLAHEISHVTQHHIAHMIAGQKVDSLAAMAAIAVAILAARSNPEASQAVLVGMQAGSIQRQLNFTRANEQEADRLGLATLQNAGFDARAMPAFFERLQRGTRLLDTTTPSYLRTHPITSERIADIDNRVRQLPYKLVADSLNFQLMRSKLLVRAKTPQEAIAYFSDALGAKKFGNAVAQRYGLVLALLRNNDVTQASHELATLQQQTPPNPITETLAGQIYRAMSMDHAELATFYLKATQSYPQHRALTYDYADLLIETGSFDEALKLLDGRIASYPSDARLYELQARAYATLGKRQEEHHALAYTYVLRGNLGGAIEQLELAKQAGTDYYQLSSIESELKEFREIAAAHVKR